MNDLPKRTLAPKEQTELRSDALPAVPGYALRRVQAGPHRVWQKANRPEAFRAVVVAFQSLSSKPKRILQKGPFLVLLAEDQGASVGQGIAFGGSGAGIGTLYAGPLDAQGWVVPGNAALVTGMIEVAGLITDGSSIGQHQEAMGKALPDQQLLMVFGA